MIGYDLILVFYKAIYSTKIGDKISGMYTFTDKLINITEKFYT